MANQVSGGTLAGNEEIMRQLARQLEALQDMGLAELRAQHRTLFGEEAKSKNLPFLRKKLAFRLQERVEGGLSPEALARIEELAPKVLPEDPARPSRVLMPPVKAKPQPIRDVRLPKPGTRLQRTFRGCTYEVDVKEDGFVYRDRTYRSLSAIAREITGTAWNGFAFFGLQKEAHHGEA